MRRGVPAAPTSTPWTEPPPTMPITGEAMSIGHPGHLGLRSRSSAWTTMSFIVLMAVRRVGTPRWLSPPTRSSQDGWLP